MGNGLPALGSIARSPVLSRGTAALLRSSCFHLQRFWDRARSARLYQEFGALPSGVSSNVKTALSKACLYAELSTGADINATRVKPWFCILNPGNGVSIGWGQGCLCSVCAEPSTANTSLWAGYVQWCCGRPDIHVKNELYFPLKSLVNTLSMLRHWEGFGSCQSGVTLWSVRSSHQIIHWGCQLFLFADHPSYPFKYCTAHYQCPSVLSKSPWLILWVCFSYISITDTSPFKNFPFIFQPEHQYLGNKQVDVICVQKAFYFLFSLVF